MTGRLQMTLANTSALNVIGLPLDNPIWTSLTTGHSGLARRTGRAARFPAEVSPLAGLQELSAQAFDDLQSLVSAQDRIALFTQQPVPAQPSWTVLTARRIDQMICLDPQEVPLATNIIPLTHADVPEMLALTALTQPGPFLPGTIRTGRYIGVRDQTGQLVAMAGQRLSLTDYVEISAVCTHPDAQGKGHATTLVRALTSLAKAEGRTAFLHVMTENGAKLVYKKCGFSLRSAINLTVLRLV